MWCHKSQVHMLLQALLEAFSAALAATGRPPLVARLRDSVFGELAAAAGSAPAFAALDTGALGAELFALGALCVPCPAGGQLLLVSCVSKAAVDVMWGSGACCSSLPPAAPVGQLWSAVLSDICSSPG